MKISNTKKIFLIAAAAIVLLLIIFALYYYFAGSNKQSPAEANTAIEQNAKSIIESGNAAQCASVNTVVDGVNYETVCKNNIAWNAAQKNLDITACNGLDNQLMSIAGCQQLVIAGLINKEGTITVCDQFTDPLKTSCINSYWSITALKNDDPSLCKNIVSSSSLADVNCQYRILLSAAMAPTSTSTPNCSLLAAPVKADCTNYEKNSCQAIIFPPLQQACQRKAK